MPSWIALTFCTEPWDDHGRPADECRVYGKGYIRSDVIRAFHRIDAYDVTFIDLGEDDSCGEYVKETPDEIYLKLR